MKIKKIIYILTMVILLVYLNQKYMYCFETNKKITFQSSVEIGPEGQSYILPNKKGFPGETLQMSGNNQKMIWAALPPLNPATTPFDISEPFLRTKDKCPSDTLFLPILLSDFDGSVRDILTGEILSEGETSSTENNETNVRGYCIVTDNGKWGEDENGKGVLSDWVWEPESSFYCLEKYQAYNMPLTFIWPRLYPVIDGREDLDLDGDEKRGYIGHFSWKDIQTIENFFHAIELKMLYSNMIDTYYSATQKGYIFWDKNSRESSSGNTAYFTQYPPMKAMFMVTSRWEWKDDFDGFNETVNEYAKNHMNPNQYFLASDVRTDANATFFNTYVHGPYANTLYYYDTGDHSSEQFAVNKCRIIHATIIAPFYSPEKHEDIKFTRIGTKFCNVFYNQSVENCLYASCDNTSCDKTKASAFFGWASAKVLCFR
ncbi:MAG: hypothetical protein JRJ44_01395 [Deltaproteobacteria bacterium]|nr:hypothetical protein [Deltaproteobacteria bacterium]